MPFVTTVFNSVKNYSYKYPIITSFALGGLYVLSFAPFNWFLLGFVSQILLIILVKNANSFKQSIKLLFSFNLAVGFLNFYWIFFSIQHTINNYVISFIMYLGFIALYFIFFIPFLILRQQKPYNITFVLKTFVALLIADTLKMYVFNGFPWLIMPAMYNNLYILQGISMFGLYGFNIINLLVIALYFIFKIKYINFFNKLLIVSPIFIMFLVILVFAWLKLHVLPQQLQANNNKTTKIRLVNTFIAQDFKYNFSLVKDTFYNTTNLAFANIDYNNPPDYIIFPEVTFGFILEDNLDLFNYFLNKIPSKSTVLLGVVRNVNNNYYNSIYIINGKTKEINFIYDKQNLVPFGEYIPFSNLLPWINSLGFSNLTAGNTKNYANINNTNIALTICFEGIFSNKDFNNNNIDFLVNISNEAWFNSSKEIYQYNILLRMRAIEGNIPVVKATNYGIPVVFNANGQNIINTSLQTANYIDLNLNY